MHAAGLVHRDVKPDNIIIEDDTGRPVLLDFGLRNLRRHASIYIKVGTPHYMAPEQAGYDVPGRPITLRADVYALGIMAFEMLAGRTPFDGNCAKLLHDHARTTPPLLSSIRADLAPFDAVVARALAKDPDDRYPTCAAFAEALTAAGHRWTSSNLPTLPMPVIAPLPARPSASPRPERPFYLLVVDDSPTFRDCTVRAAQIATQRRRWSRSVVVEGVESGQEALDRAAVQPPDLVLLDLDMPGLDGIDTLSRLRALPGGDAARVVVLSGRVRPSDRWRFAVLGVSEFLGKQVEFPALVDRIEAIAKRYDDSMRGRLL